MIDCFATNHFSYEFMHKNLVHLLLPISILIVYIGLITFQPSLQLWPESIVWFIDRQRLLELLLLGLVLVDASIFGKKDYFTIETPKFMQWSLVLILILASFSTLLAYSPRHAAVEVSTFIALGYLSLRIARYYQANHAKCIQYLTYILWGSVALYLLSFYTGYFTATIVKKTLDWPHPFTGFSNIRNFNQYQLWTLGFLTLPLLLPNIKKSTRFVLHAALTAWWVLLFYSASRGVLVAWAAAITLTALCYKKSVWHFIQLQISHSVIGLISFYLLFKVIPAANQSILNTSDIVRNTSSGRLALWDQALIMVKAFPIFGAGPMHFAWYNKTNAHPHNSILQFASEWGLPATIILLSICIYGLYYWLKRFNANRIQKDSRLNGQLAIVLLFTIAANFIYSMVDGVIVTPISQVLMFTTLGIMLGHYVSSKKEAYSHTPKLRPILASVILVVMAWSTYPEIKQGFSGDKKGFSMGYSAIGPRFWKNIPN